MMRWLYLLFFISTSTFAYNLSLINKTSSDIEIEYVICTVTHEHTSDTDKCASDVMKFSIPARGLVKNPFPTTMKPKEMIPNTSYTFTYPYLLSIKSLSGGFDKIKFVTKDEYRKCDSKSEKNSTLCNLIHRGESRSIDVVHNGMGGAIYSAADDDFAWALIIDDEGVGFLHVQLIGKPGLP